MNDPVDAHIEFKAARFPISLNLPDIKPQTIEDAQEAVRREFRDSVKWKRLVCRSVEILSESKTGSVYILNIGHAVEFDWTWEGATAFRPTEIDSVSKKSDALGSEFNDANLADSDAVDIQESILWSGEILEVDEATGKLFVCISNPEYPPTKGSFYVRPFEFLAFLYAVFHESALESLRRLIPGRLLATEGCVHPKVARSSSSQWKQVGLPELQDWWSCAWSVLWGPPGTGKTYTTGQQVARALDDPSERILVVSTTNKATDASAMAIGRAARLVVRHDLDSGALLRIGKGASLRRFESEKFTCMLKGTESEFLAEVEKLAIELAQALRSEDKAILRKDIKELREQMRDSAFRNFLDSQVRVVVATAFKATTFLKSDSVRQCIESGHAPFTTIFIDEAGLISRSATAALSLLASRRVVLVGDSKQLAPISRISRILPTNQMKWLAQSGLSHLDSITTHEVGVHVLQEQRRMHADVCDVVSAYQYDGFLRTASSVHGRGFQMPSLLSEQPRAIWYVLDDDTEELPTIRAERGPGNRSWMRTATMKVLDRLFADPSLGSCAGLFIAPFSAQAKRVAAYFAKKEFAAWSASTVHSQQGSEADIVIFDTVNGGSYSWPYDEWKRLINVALSRARESVIVIASRAEMEEPYLRPLVRHLSPRVLRKQGKKYRWEVVDAQTAFLPASTMSLRESDSVGYQISERRDMRPVLSYDQERLCGMELDGKPRLVRGVAGSGKTLVLAHWLMQTVRRLAGQPNIRIWAVFANRSLQSLIGDSIESAWSKASGEASFPWQRVSLLHIREVLDVMLPEAGLDPYDFEFDYDAAASAYLDRSPLPSIQPRCDALFVDEAQDMGPNALKLLSAIVRRTDESDRNSRSVNIFYDNAQNIYGRGTPTWSEMGLDMRGRSTVMKESFRSTRPITEFAMNVLYRLQPPDSLADHRELVARGLIEPSLRDGVTWWNVRFNQIDGPKPIFRQFGTIEREFDAIGDYCRELIATEGVQPSDIVLLYNGKLAREKLEEQVAPKLAEFGVELSIQTNRPFSRSSRVMIASTSQSYKGYDAEIIIIPSVDFFVSKDKGILANSLYVAMTRARSMLTLFGQRMESTNAKQLYQVIDDCLDRLHDRPTVDSEISLQAELIDVLDLIGHEHQSWLMDLWNRFRVSQEPLLGDSGEILAEPLFWFKNARSTVTCFGKEQVSQRMRQRLEDANIRLIELGEIIV